VSPRRAVVVALAAGAGLLTGCAVAPHDSGSSAAGGSAKVAIALTGQGCRPTPASIAAGPVDFTVRNAGTGAVTEAELRTHDLAHILGEQENLSPGLSGGFSMTLDPGTYMINCPGADQSRWPFTVTAAAGRSVAPTSPALRAATAGYARYVGRNVAGLVTSSRSLCRAIAAGDLATAKLRYPRTRVYYERIEPVAEIWGSLDTSIDGRWQNPVTVRSQFVGFHRLEQLMWADHTLRGAVPLCAGLVHHERQLQALVSKAEYTPLELASGATDLINEAATSKITGEEERYSDTDLVVFEANVQAAQAVVGLLTPYVRGTHPAVLTRIAARHRVVAEALARYRRSPGYDDTGYVSYRDVSQADRRALSGSVNAYAEALSALTTAVSTPA
jgi:iron uptake system component EfeO